MWALHWELVNQEPTIRVACCLLPTTQKSHHTRKLRNKTLGRKRVQQLPASVTQCSEPVLSFQVFTGCRLVIIRWQQLPSYAVSQCHVSETVGLKRWSKLLEVHPKCVHCTALLLVPSGDPQMLTSYCLSFCVTTMCHYIWSTGHQVMNNGLKQHPEVKEQKQIGGWTP